MVRKKAVILFEIDILRLAEIQLYINANLDKELSVSTLAQHFAIAGSTLRKQFASYYNTPIYSYILERRMKTAMDLILKKHAPLKKIAMMTGYKRQTSFTHTFCRYFGHPPVHYLK